MKIKKILLIGAVGIVVLGIIGVIVLAVCLDGIVKTGVETVGPKIAQVPITLDSIHIGVLSGSAKVKNLVVGNPEGYKTPFAISVGVAEVGVVISSALSDKIVIHTIHVESPEITFEGGLSGNNLSKILANVNSIAQSTSPAATNAQTTASGKPPKKIEVDDFLITGAKVHVSLTGVGLNGKEMTLPLPDIHLTDLGKGDAGLTPADLTSRVLDAITTATLKAVASSVGDLGKGVENLGKGAGKAATDSLNKISTGLGGLFKKK